MTNMIWNLLLSASPVILAGLGALLTQFTGVLNIGLEGIILLGAFATAGVLVGSTSPLLALLVGGLAGALGALVIIWAHLRHNGNIFIAGLAINLAAWGLIPVLSQIFFGVKGVLGLEQQIGFQMNLSGWLVILVALSLCLVLLLWWILRFRRPGIAVRMISSNLQGALEFGLPVRRFQFFSLLISGVLGGLAGSILVFKLGAYVPNMSAGRGWIALVVVFLGNTSPIGVLIGSLLFVGAEYIAGEAQAAASVPGLFVGLPYLITFIALVLWSALQKKLSK